MRKNFTEILEMSKKMGVNDEEVACLSTKQKQELQRQKIKNKN